MAFKKTRTINSENRNKRIEEMDLEEVKNYLCMKHFQNPDKCMTCPGLSTCKAGQRVAVLYDERDRRKATEAKAQKRTVSPQKWWTTEKSEAYIREVLISGDPIAFLMEREGLTVEKAKRKINNWHRNHANVFIETGHPASLRKSATDKRRALYEECMATENPAKYYMDKTGCTLHNARGMIYKMKLEFENEKPETVKAAGIKEPDTTKTIDTEEVSITEFLNEFTRANQPEEQTHVEEIPNGTCEKEAEETETSSAEEQEPEHNACGIPYKLLDTQNHIAEEMNKVEMEIKRLQEYHNSLKLANDAVSMTMSLIGVKITDKSVANVLKYYK